MANQIIIDIGAAANDGTGDPLRTAFNYVNENFTSIWDTGVANSNVIFSGNRILTVNTNGNLVLAPNGTGKVQANVDIIPNANNTHSLGSGALRWNTVYTQNLDVGGNVSFDNLTVNGNLTVQGDIIQIGNIVTDSKTIQLANTAGTANAANGSGITVGANDNIATFLFNSSANTWATNIGLQITSSGNTWRFNNNFMTAPSGASWQSVPSTLDEYISSARDGYINLTSLYANGNTASQVHLEHGLATIEVSNGINQVWTFDDAGNLTLPGNTFAVNYANGNPVTINSSSYGNANVATFLANFGSNTISTTGNITSNGVVNVNSLSVNQTANAWTIAGNTISAPSGATWNSDPVFLDEYITSARDGYINLTSLYANGNTASQVHLEHGLAQIVVNNGSEYIWQFDDAGNLTVPGNIQTISTGFPFSSNISSINTGSPTVIVTLTDAVFGAAETGQVTISGVVGTTQANNTWYYASIDPSNFVLYNDAAVTIPVNGNTWTAYISGGLAVSQGYSNVSITGGNVNIVTNTGNTWTFDNQGGTIFPTLTVTRGDRTGTLTGQALLFGDSTQEAIISTPNGTNDINSSQRFVINPGAGADGTTGEGGDIYLYAGRGGDAGGSGGDIKIRGGLGPVNGAGGYITMEGGEADVNGVGGYIEIYGGVSGNSNGGYLDLRGGVGQTEGGAVFIQGGQGQAGPGGPVNITGGVSGNGLAEYGNVGVIAGASGWVFDNTGNLALPRGGVVYETNIPYGGLDGNTIALKPSGGTNADQQLMVYPTAGNIDANHLHLTTGNLYNTELFLGNDDLYVKLANTGNVVVNSNDNTGNSAQWTFGTNESLTLPGGSRLRPLGANLDIFAGTGSYVNLITADESSYMGVDGSGGYIVTAGGTWGFSTTGNLTAPGNVSAVGNITGGNIVTSGSGGDITMSGGNITGVGNISAGNVNTTGNVTAANFFGNGATLSNVATQVASSWTLAAGTNTANITVPLNGTYSMWVRGNIPNGIVVWNATVTVTNNNVPAIGQQFAWYYPAPGNALVLTSIPAQIIGTANTISNATPAVGTTTNVFEFTIDNNSGNSAVVNYGYTKIS